MLCTTHQISLMRWVNHVARLRARRGSYRILVAEFEVRRPLERLMRRRDDTTKTDLRKVGWGLDWIDLAQDMDRWRAVVNAVMNFWVS